MMFRLIIYTKLVFFSCFIFLNKTYKSQSLDKYLTKCSNVEIILDNANKSNELGLRGDFKEKLNVDKKILTLLKSNCPDYKNDINYYDIIYGLAFDYFRIYDYELSISYNELNIKEIENIKWTEINSYTNSLRNLGEAYYYTGNYAKSLENYNKCLDTAKKYLGISNIYYATILNDLGNIYLRIGDFEKSLYLFNECLIVYESVFNGNQKNQLEFNICMANIASVYSAMGNYEKSKLYNLECQDYYERYISVNSKPDIRITNNSTNTDDFHMHYVGNLMNLATDYYSLGDYENCYSIILKAKTLFSNSDYYNEEDPLYIDILGVLASSSYQLDNYHKSIEYNSEKLRIIKKKFGDKHIFYGDILYQIAFDKDIIGEYLNAAKLFSESYKIHQKHYFLNSIGFSENERLKFRENLLNSLKVFISYSIIITNENEYFLSDISSALINTKGILLSTNQQIKDKVLSSKDTYLVNLYKRWENGNIQLGRYYETPLNELEENGVDLKAEEERVNTLEQELSRKSLSFAESQKRYSWKDVKNKLQTDEAYIELIRIDYNDFQIDRSTDTVYYAALIINENTKEYPELVLLENGIQLEQEGYRYYNSHTSGRNKQNLDEYSYLSYWSAIAEKLVGKKRVFISSDGVYNKLNLDVLYNKATEKYLGEEMDIRLVTSGRDLFKTYPEEDKELTAVLVGSPKYDLIQEQDQEEDFLVSRDLQQYWIDSLSRGWSVSALPGTAVEVNNISVLMIDNKWKVTTYKEEEAIEGNVKSVSSPTVLHIATHGYFFEDVENEKESPSRMMGVDTEKATQNPLLRSGLLFAGAKNTLNGKELNGGDNGLLTAYEASYMDLNGTELVVLSACNTARGEIKNGEGVYGLQRAIQQAGAENIIMSMWKVDDKVTQEFMSLFYKTWLAGSTKREAFNRTQQQIKETYKDPYYWGAFVMIGK